MTAFPQGPRCPAVAQPGRRPVALALLGALGLVPIRSGLAVAQGTDGATILAPGPDDGGSARWAARAGAALARGMQRPGTMRLSVLGGPDGVTAANRFATLDGSGPSLLVLPGHTFHARLAGSTRARFEPRAWMPLLLSWQGAVLAGRGPLPGRGTMPLRVAMPSPEAPEAAALAALDLLGVPAQGIIGQPEAAFASGEADALIVLGAEPLLRAQALGAASWYGFPVPGEADALEVPAFPVTSPGAQAMVAAVAAMQIRAALVTPVLTAADSVATWRRAAARWQEEERGLSAEGLPLVGAAAAAAFTLLLPGSDAVLDYRHWLDRRLGWRPA